MSDEESYEYEYDDDEMDEGNNFEYTDDEEQGNDSEVALGKSLTLHALCCLLRNSKISSKMMLVVFKITKMMIFFNFNFKVWQSW